MPHPISDCSILQRGRMPAKAYVRDSTTQDGARSDPPGSFSTSSKPQMGYVVNLTARAERDLVWLHQTINVAGSQTALKWYRKLKQVILSLEENPNRCSLTPESEKYRHLLYGRKPHVYRVIY